MKEIYFNDMAGNYGYIEESEETEKKEKYFNELKKVLKAKNLTSFYYSNMEKCFKGTYKKQGKNFWIDLVPKSKSKDGNTRLLLIIEDAFNNRIYKYYEA